MSNYKKFKYNGNTYYIPKVMLFYPEGYTPNTNLYLVYPKVEIVVNPKKKSYFSNLFKFIGLLEEQDYYWWKN